MNEERIAEYKLRMANGAKLEEIIAEILREAADMADTYDRPGDVLQMLAEDIDPRG